MHGLLKQCTCGTVVKALNLVLASLTLVVAGIGIAYLSSVTQQTYIYYYNVSNAATPPPGWYDNYWSVLDYGPPKGEVVVGNSTVELPNVTPLALPRPEPYVYIVSGYVQPYAYLSPLSFFLVLVGSFLGFKGTVLVFQERALGEELVRGYAVGGSLGRFALKRFVSSVISLAIVSTITIVLEGLHGSDVLRVAWDFLTFNPGVSTYFHVSIRSLILTSLAYTSLLVGLSFALTVYLSAFLVVYGLQGGLLRSVVEKWRYVGSALASWVIAMAIIYLLHFFTGLLPYGHPRGDLLPYLVMPLLSLFFPYVGITANKVVTSIQVPRQSFKGLDWRIMVYRHALGNAVVVMLTAMASAFMEMLVAEVLVEGIFVWPGFGELLKQAVFHGDYRVVEAAMLTYSTIAVLSNFITDVVYGALDPRVTR